MKKRLAPRLSARSGSRRKSFTRSTSSRPIRQILPSSICRRRGYVPRLSRVPAWCETFRTGIGSWCRVRAHSLHLYRPLVHLIRPIATSARDSPRCFSSAPVASRPQSSVWLQASRHSVSPSFRAQPPSHPRGHALVEQRRSFTAVARAREVAPLHASCGRASGSDAERATGIAAERSAERRQRRDDRRKSARRATGGGACGCLQEPADGARVGEGGREGEGTVGGVDCYGVASWRYAGADVPQEQAITHQIVNFARATRGRGRGAQRPRRACFRRNCAEFGDRTCHCFVGRPFPLRGRSFASQSRGPVSISSATLRCCHLPSDNVPFHVPFSTTTFPRNIVRDGHASILWPSHGV